MIELRMGKGTKTGIGMRKDRSKPRNRMAKVSKNQKFINSLRISLKIAILRIYGAVGFPPHVPGCPASSLNVTNWDLDEIEGRHTGGSIPGTLDPANQQLLRRCCHSVKTDKGHVDYRTEKIKAELNFFHTLILNTLPMKSGENPYSKDDLDKAIRESCVYIMESELYQGEGKPCV